MSKKDDERQREIHEFLSKQADEFNKFFKVGPKVDNAVVLFVKGDDVTTGFLNGNGGGMIKAIHQMMDNADLARDIVLDAVMAHLVKKGEAARDDFIMRLIANGVAYDNKDKIKEAVSENCKECEEKECPVHPSRQEVKEGKISGDDFVKRKPCSN